MVSGQVLSAGDRAILRELARHQLELANSPENQRLIPLWYKLNECAADAVPLIHLELGTFEQEVIPHRLRCEGETARGLEGELYRNFLNFELFGDDMLVPDYFPIRWQQHFVPFGLEVKVERTGGLGHQFTHQLEDLAEDLPKLGKARFGVNRQATEAHRQLAEDAFGDVLPVRMDGAALYAVPTQHLVHLMGMEALYLNLCDNPELFLETMDRLAEDYLSYFACLQASGALLPTTTRQPLGQGSLCYNHTLKDAAPVNVGDMFGFMDSQETVSISPDMFKALIFPAYRKIAQAYGLLSYGCCEPMHAIWDDCLAGLPNLRKVSISPWCNQQMMGERLRGRKTVFHRKPSPNYLGVDAILDEAAFSAHIKQTLDAAQGCTLEITQRDVYTIHNNEAKARRYVQIIREGVEQHWKG